MAHIEGFTCLNDVTARDIQKRDVQWTRAKSFDSFCPVGPEIVKDIDPNNLTIRSFLNGELRQDSNTAEFIFTVEDVGFVHITCYDTNARRYYSNGNARRNWCYA